MQTFLASPQHVAADHLGRFASRVRLAVLARRNPSAREEDSQATTLNSNRHYNQNDFRFECSADAIYLYYYIVKDQNSNRFRKLLLCPGGQKPHPSHSCFRQEIIAANGTWFLATS